MEKTEDTEEFAVFCVMVKRLCDLVIDFNAEDLSEIQVYALLLLRFPFLNGD